tara:strand:+ start:460 stop:645 length:186 start_codon:yes stop_codon:yes gene_type:complete
MPQELLAALVGAAISAILMVVSNRSSRRQGDIREIFHRLNAIEKDIATLTAKRNPNGWRNR